LNQIFKSVVSHATLEDNPTSKIRSLMLKSVAGNRDLGQCEISRLLMSEPHYRSSFCHVTVSLEINIREIDCQTYCESAPATKNSLLDYYSRRKSNPLLAKYDHLLLNFLEFTKYFHVSKNQLCISEKPDLTVVITMPSVHYQPEIREVYSHYCYYQIIKYSSWTIDDVAEITNLNTAIERWENFLIMAPDSVKNALR
jgi:hypothetical protein